MHRFQLRDFLWSGFVVSPSIPSFSSVFLSCRFVLIQSTSANLRSSLHAGSRIRNRLIALTTSSPRRCLSKSFAAARLASTDLTTDFSGKDFRETIGLASQLVGSSRCQFHSRFPGMQHVACHFVVLYRVPSLRHTTVDTFSAHRKLLPNVLILWKFAWLNQELAWEMDFGSCCDWVDLEWTMSEKEREIS